MNITAINTDRLAISTPEIEQRRATMAADWFIRVHTPKWLDLAGLILQADLLRRMPEITDFKNCPTLMPTLFAIEADALAAWDAAWDAAWVSLWGGPGDAHARAGARAWSAEATAAAAKAASGDAAWVAATDAAGAAARAAARVAARAAAAAAAAAAAGDAAAAAAAGDAAADAAWFASRAAARAAAWDATAAKLQPTIDDLQSSAVDLVERMSAVQS